MRKAKCTYFHKHPTMLEEKKWLITAKTDNNFTCPFEAHVQNTALLVLKTEDITFVCFVPSVIIYISLIRNTLPFPKCAKHPGWIAELPLFLLIHEMICTYYTRLSQVKQQVAKPQLAVQRISYFSLFVAKATLYGWLVLPCTGFIWLF